MSLEDDRKHTMFGERRWKKLAEVVSLETPAHARQSVMWLTRHFDELSSRKHKVAVKRSCVLARNRALVIAARKGLPPKRKKDFEEVAKIYEKAYKGMKLD